MDRQEDSENTLKRNSKKIIDYLHLDIKKKYEVDLLNKSQIFNVITKIKPDIIGVSLKAGTKSSKEPKLNSYVGTTLRKPMWVKAYPNAMEELRTELWEKVYSKVPNLPKSVTKKNYLTLSSSRQIPNKILQDKVLSMFKYDNLMFEALYVRMNTICRDKLCSMINGNINATKQWIEDEFRLEKPAAEVEVPLILVKAVGTKATEQGDKLAKIFPKITKVNARLNSSSVQEWFIDVFSGKEKLTLIMTIRSDSEFRKEKQKGKLGAYTMLKLLYRGYK